MFKTSLQDLLHPSAQPYRSSVDPYDCPVTKDCAQNGKLEVRQSGSILTQGSWGPSPLNLKKAHKTWLTFPEKGFFSGARAVILGTFDIYVASNSPRPMRIAFNPKRRSCCMGHAFGCLGDPHGT